MALWEKALAAELDASSVTNDTRGKENQFLPLFSDLHMYAVIR